MEKVGIDNLKKTVGLVLQIGMQVDKTTAGGHKFNFADSISFIPEIMQVPGIIKNSAALKAEVADLSDPERKELNDYIQTEFQISNEHTEAVIKQALNVVEEIFELISVIRNTGAQAPQTT